MKGYCERGNLCGFAHGVDQLHNSPVVIAKKGLQKIGEISSIDDEYNVSENYIFVKNKRMDPGKTSNLPLPLQTQLKNDTNWVRTGVYGDGSCFS